MYKLPALLIAASLLLSIPLRSQKKFTVSAFTGSGLSFFGGPGAVSKSTYYRTGLSFPGSIPDTMADPFGRKPFTNFLAGLQADISLSSKWILIVTSQYEHTGGRLTSDSVVSSSGTTQTNGKYSRYYDFISINPQIGRILFQKTVIVIVHAGIDYTSKLSTGNNFSYTNQSGQKNVIGYSGGEPEKNDARVSFGTSVVRRRWSLDINYKYGFVNYWKYGTDKVYSRLLHARILYAFLTKKI